ncbi:MAG: valine--tRNA ligase [Actinobacteria bacterium]|nr:MAG: valine--tRNA ligase [Actinomycetota bacterium]
MTRELQKSYDPHAVEDRLYREWEEAGLFAPSGDGAPFCIVLPPPNVTGSLHIGHALDHSIQDAIIRRKRMQGFRALWLPGMDHAGIATQNVVERELAKEGTSRHDLGREAFVARVWKWKEESGGTITRQMRRLGDSVDWSRERFTMDEQRSLAVRTVFVRLYDEGLIYRGNRITNWCPNNMTALSDIEVEHEDTVGELVELKYPLKDGSGHITIATTRVETMLADTGVAVNPTDERYKDLVGKAAILPIMNRELPIVADEAIDKEFGTGALKVTPAHDPVDFEIGQRHGLPAITVIGLDGRMNENAGPYAGLDRYEARKAVLDELRAQGLVGTEIRPYVHPVGHCQRCHAEVEPLLMEQWYLRVAELARAAIAAVREGRTRFVPQRFERNYFDWMENLRDWCISRQLWWGHRIPVFTCANGHQFASVDDPAACPRCESAELEQDPDVLDTWFSSALWPFSTLGWPDKTQDLEDFYPTSVLVTGYDIITFWVSRMMMMGVHFMEAVPFFDVHIHGMVRDFRGKKMSKSFGNVIDPLVMIDKYGADALRLTLIRGATLGSDVPVDEKWIEGDRNFCNKLWNISRFALLNGAAPAELPARDRLTLADRWILSRLDTVTREADWAMEEYDFARAAQTLRQFTWNEFADWYVEWSKGRLYDGTEEEKADQRALLAHVLERVLVLLHPIMPFITEELWRALTGGETLVRAPWPTAGDHADEDAERAIAFLQDVIGALRRFRADHGIDPKTKPAAAIVAEDAVRRALIEAEMERVRALGNWGELTIASSVPEAAQEARLVLDGARIHVPLAGLLDIDEERRRIERDIAKHHSELERIGAKLADRAFTERAPEEVVETQRERLTREQEAIAHLEQASRDLA